jgi:hypothetical protein
MVIPQRWLLTHGEGFTTRLKTPELDPYYTEQGQCYANAARLLMHFQVSDEDYAYTEGYAIRHRLGIPIEHAWLTHMRTKEVLDPTWSWDEGPQGFSYFGVPYTYEFLVAELARREVYGLHSDGVMYNTALFTRDPKEFRAWDKETT